MFRLTRLILLVLAAALPLRAQEVPVAGLPDWVEPLDLPDFPAALYAHVRDGEAYHLLDRQTRWVDGRRQTYARMAIEVVNRAGMERVATLARDFDPEIESMSVVAIDILRDGERIALAERLRPTLLRRETRLDAGIIDGTLTAHFDLPGVRVGDIVDVAFLWDSGEYLPGMNREVSMDLEFDVPVALSRLLVHWPDGVPLHSLAQDGLEFRETAEAGGRRLEWRRGPLPPEAREPATADLESYYDAVYLTPAPDWETISAPLTGHYAKARPVPEAWEARLEAIRAENASDTARAYAALRLVQDEIRYVGLEVGAGGFFAREPEQVVAQAFGDCKDKALLLKTLLEGLGIEAQVALASLDHGYDLKGAVPQSTAFDHMIAAAKLRGRWVWMDPTLRYQGGVGNTATEPDLGWVLPVTGGRDDLVAIRADRPVQWFRAMTEVFSFSREGVSLNVVTRMHGESAAREREDWDSRPVAQIAQGYLDYYAALYPGIRQTALPRIEDRRVSDNVTVRESYLIPAEALRRPELWHDFPFVSEFTYSPYPDPGPRSAGLAIPHHTRIEHEVVVEGAPIRFEPPDPVRIENPGFQARFEASAGPGRGRLRLSWSYETRARSVTAEEAAEVLDEAEEARDLRVLSWDFGDPPGTGWLGQMLDRLNQARP